MITTTEVDLLLREQAEIIEGLRLALKATEEEAVALRRQVDILFPSIPPVFLTEKKDSEQAIDIGAAVKAMGYSDFQNIVAEIRARLTDSIAAGAAATDARDLLLQIHILHISDLHRRLADAMARATKAEAQARFYDLIQKACLENEMVMDEWKRFCAVLSMVAADDTPAVNNLVNA